LKDAASGAQIWGDLWLLLAVQGLPVPIVLCVLFAVWFAAAGWCIPALLAVGIECIFGGGA
jgi:dolichol-phosphate mannosyltransferase